MPGLPHPHDSPAHEDHEQSQHRETVEPTVHWASWDEARRIAKHLLPVDFYHPSAADLYRAAIAARRAHRDRTTEPRHHLTSQP